MDQRVVVVTGVMASGKSTVAQLLAARYDRSVHLRGDVFRRMIVSGRIEPTPENFPDAQDQLDLRYRLAGQVADEYAVAGFTVVWQDVILGEAVARLPTLVHTRPFSLVVLAPRPETIAEREAGRGKSGYGDDWTPYQLDAGLRAETPRLGLWLDTSEQTPEQTVEEILDRITESELD